MDETSKPEAASQVCNTDRVRNVARRAVLAAVVGAGFVTLGLIAGQESATAAEDVDTSLRTSVVSHVTGELGSVDAPTDAAGPVSVDPRSLDAAASTITREVAEAARAVESAVTDRTRSPVAASPPAPAVPPAPAAPPAPPAPARPEPAVVDTVTESVDVANDAVADTSESVAARAEKLLPAADDPVVEIGHAVADPPGRLIDQGARPVVDVLDAAADALLPGQPDAVSDLPGAAVDLLERVVFGPSPLPTDVPLPAAWPPDASDSAATGAVQIGTRVPVRTSSDRALPSAQTRAMPSGASSLHDTAHLSGGGAGASETAGVASAGDLPLRGTPSGLPYDGSPPATVPGASSSAGAGPGSVALLVASVLPHPGWGHALRALADTSWCGGIAFEPGSTPD